jgi:hypothetical protein
MMPMKKQFQRVQDSINCGGGKERGGLPYFALSPLAGMAFY